MWEVRRAIHSVVVVPVAGRHPLFPVVGTAPLARYRSFGLLRRVDAKTAGRGGSPDHVESHAQRILDVGNLLAGVSMKSRVSPFPHPLDQFRRDHPLPEEQGKDVGLEQATQDGGIEDGRGDETSVVRKAPAGARTCRWGCQFKNSAAVWMETMARKSVPFRVFPEEHGKGFPGAQGKLGRSRRRYRKAGRKILGSAKTDAGGGRADHLLADELCPQGGAFGAAGGQNPRCLQRRRRKGVRCEAGFPSFLLRELFPAENGFQQVGHSGAGLSGS